MPRGSPRRGWYRRVKHLLAAVQTRPFDEADQHEERARIQQAPRDDGGVGNGPEAARMDAHRDEHDRHGDEAELGGLGPVGDQVEVVSPEGKAEDGADSAVAERGMDKAEELEAEVVAREEADRERDGDGEEDPADRPEAEDGFADGVANAAGHGERIRNRGRSR